jgi:hypothetical protein
LIKRAQPCIPGTDFLDEPVVLFPKCGRSQIR